MNHLEEIIAHKRREVENLRGLGTSMHRAAIQRNDFRSLRLALRSTDDQMAIIAEIKKASPSAGTIVGDFDPASIARRYEGAGASALSVLTDARFFQGDLTHLIAAREAVSVPVLRKDFVIDEVQIAEACAAGADAVLLIVAALNQKQLIALSDAAAKYQLDALVEVHTLEELERALEARAEIVGINNRDLSTFEIDLEITERLSEEVPNDILLVSESGIRTVADVQRIKSCGANAVLIGEALMRGELSIEAIRGT